MLATRKRSGAGRLTKNSKIFKAIIHALQEKKATDIVSLDMRKIPEAVADFFVICTAGSNTQVRALTDFVEEHVETVAGERPYKHEGMQSMQWVLIDYVNIVVHIMLKEPRGFYKLEEMWSDAPRDEHDDFK
jgi:ribosome-associated protein